VRAHARPYDYTGRLGQEKNLPCRDAKPIARSLITWPVRVPRYLTLGMTALGADNLVRSCVVRQQVEKPQNDVQWQDFVLVALIARVLVRICFHRIQKR
jgi:hypothetical protein